MLKGIYSVDQIYRRFYNQLGGQDTLGPAISPVFQNDGVIYQYTVSALLVHDPQHPSGQQTHLAPLGLDMGIRELQVPQPDRADERNVGGHIIFADFVPFFEKLGVFKPESGPLSFVHLLAYGSWKCSSSCRHSPPQDSLIILPSLNAVPFLRTVESLGSEFTGFALTEPYLASDGNLEQIYEHAVMIAQPENPDHVSLRHIPEKLGIMPDALEPPNDDPNVYFYMISGGDGYNLPWLFMGYVKLHEGIEVIGTPITGLTHQSELVYLQCFKHLYLDELKDPSGNSRIQPVLLGYTYRELFYNPTARTSDFVPSPEISVQIWESCPHVAPDQEQEIGVNIIFNHDPLPEVQPVLILTLPDGSQSAYPMPSTGSDAQTRLQLGPINADHGTLIQYQVCVTMMGGQNICVMNSYLIWKADYSPVTPQVPPGYGTCLSFVLQNIKIYLPSISETFRQYLLCCGNDSLILKDHEARLFSVKSCN